MRTGLSSFFLFQTGSELFRASSLVLPKMIIYDENTAVVHPSSKPVVDRGVTKRALRDISDRDKSRSNVGPSRADNVGGGNGATTSKQSIKKVKVSLVPSSSIANRVSQVKGGRRNTPSSSSSSQTIVSEGVKPKPMQRSSAVLVPPAAVDLAAIFLPPLMNDRRIASMWRDMGKLVAKLCGEEDAGER